LRPGNPESCNCGNVNKTAEDANDLHLVLIRYIPQHASCCKPTKHPPAECKTAKEESREHKSVTAEISPHFRPDEWNVDRLCKVATEHPLRLKGQLMYDASHRLGVGHPYRVSNWEIHPVYAVDVCTEKSLSACKADNNLVWKPLDQWPPP